MPYAYLIHLLINNDMPYTLLKQGVIFSVDYYLLNNFLATASDDRSVNVFKIHFHNDDDDNKGLSDILN